MVIAEAIFGAIAGYGLYYLTEVYKTEFQRLKFVILAALPAIFLGWGRFEMALAGLIIGTASFGVLYCIIISLGR